MGLAAYRIEQAQLFLGRQKETLDALACFFDIRPGRQSVRWLEINGNSGCGKSSLMQAGLLPLIDKGWLWRPRSQYEDWKRMGPMMPGGHPVEMLAECLAKAFDGKMGEIVEELKRDDNALRFWLRGKKTNGTAFLLAIDQFEELFTFSDPEERGRFDRLLAGALDDPDCPLFVISTVRADFLDRFEDLPRLVAVRNRVGRPWTLAPIGTDGLREVIAGPARLAGLDVSEVQEAMVAEARDEPGALPLVENALRWLWEKRSGRRLSGRLFTEQGRLAGILSGSADGLLSDLAADQQNRALEILFQLVRVDPEGSRHARRRLSFADALAVAGDGESGRALVNRLAGERSLDVGKAKGPVRLITITDEGCWVNLIHETLIRSKGLDAAGKAQPYWPRLWIYIEQHRERAAWHERIAADTYIWLTQHKNASYQWSHERAPEATAALRQVGPEVVLSADESEFLGPIDPDAMLAELNQQETTHKRRLLIGERLDVFGDPRPGVGVDKDGTPRIDWRSVPDGNVMISVLSDPNDANSTVKNKLNKKVGPFQIARYPITVALNWFDAVAFCRWLSRRLGKPVRLPDEWEWQQAATGGSDKNVFPWRPDWDAKREPCRANTFESRLGQTAAVGMYPAGASATDVLDMAGTVWEWCLNKFEAPEVTSSGASDFDSRVLRGGSWFDSQVLARSAYRLRYIPYGRVNFVGFRVVCSSPSSDTEH